MLPLCRTITCIFRFEDICFSSSGVGERREIAFETRLHATVRNQNSVSWRASLRNVKASESAQATTQGAS